MTTESTASTTMTDEEYEALSTEERSRLRGDNGSGSDPAAASVAAPGVSPASTPAADPASTSEGADAQEEGKGGHGIPRARFNEVNERRREAEELAAAQAQELAELRARLAQQPSAGGGEGGARTPAPAQAPAQAPAFDVQEAEERYSQALLEGDTKAAAAVRTEINRHIEEAAFQRMVQATTQQQAQNQIAGAVESLLQQHPWLDTDEGAEALELIEAAAEAKARRGMAFAKAIQEATAAIAPRFAPPDRVVQQGADSGDIRTQRANERGAVHSLQQPPLPQAGMGNRATPVSVDTSKLSDEEYMALPEAERKKARGD